MTWILAVCLQTNSAGQADQFEREAVVGQVRAMQLLESTSLYAGGQSPTAYDCYIVYVNISLL